MTQIVQEGIEPLLIGTSLLQRIEFQAGMQTVFPAIEPLRAEEAGDGMDLPIYNINIGGAQSFGVTVKRHGTGVNQAVSPGPSVLPPTTPLARARPSRRRATLPHCVLVRERAPSPLHRSRP